MSQTVPPGFGEWAAGSKYELRGTLGTGAMGVVLDGFDRVIQRRVAIKVVRKPSADEVEAVEAFDRFRREPAAAGGLSHPGIVGIYDYGENGLVAWMVMEMVTGGTLERLLKSGGHLPLPSAVELTIQVLRALSHAHARGVVHRDIKPANIMLTEDGQPKLVDFGVARTGSSELTQHGQMIGTPSHMAPEQFRGEPVDARADIWATGVLLYQLLTGRKPFPGELPALIHKVLNTEPPLPSELVAAVPRAMDAVVMRALAKRPDDRWPDAKTFADAVSLAMTAPAASPPPSGGDGAGHDTGSRGPKPIQASRPDAPRDRRRGWLAAAGGLGVLAAGGLAAFLYLPVTVPPKEPPPRPDLRGAAEAALAAAPCGLLSSRVEEAAFAIQGVLPRAEAERLRAELAGRALPPGAARLDLGLFEGPFCTMFAALRPALAEPGAAPALSVDGAMPLRQGERLRFSVQMPDWANHLHVAFATSDGSLVRLEPGAEQRPGSRVRLGEPRPGFPGWEIDEPFGTDLLLAVVSDGPFVPPGAPVDQFQAESQAEYAEGFAQALRAAQDAGRRVSLRPVVIETAARD